MLNGKLPQFCPPRSHQVVNSAKSLQTTPQGLKLFNIALEVMRGSRGGKKFIIFFFPTSPGFI